MKNRKKFLENLFLQKNLHCFQKDFKIKNKNFILFFFKRKLKSFLPEMYFEKSEKNSSHSLLLFILMGDTLNCMNFFLPLKKKQGIASVHKHDKLVSYIVCGDYFGEIAIIEAIHRSITVRAVKKKISDFNAKKKHLKIASSNFLSFFSSIVNNRYILIAFY